MEKRVAIMRTRCIHASAEGKCNYTDGLDMRCHGDTCSAYERETYSYTHCVTKSLHHPKWNHEWQQPESPEEEYSMSWFQNNIGGCEFEYYIGCELCNKDCPNRTKDCEELTDNDHYYNAQFKKGELS